jgi:thermitase
LGAKIKPMLRNSPFLLILLFLVLSQDACCSQATKRPEYAAGEVLVKFKANVSLAEAKSLHRRLESKILKHFERINVDLVKIREGWTVEKAIEAYQADPNVEYAEPNYIRRIQTEK